MSLRQLQTQKFLEFITASYLASGKKPTDAEIFQALNYYFSQNPAGSPVRMPDDVFRAKVKSNVDDINDFMASVYVNLDTLFEQIDAHIEQNITLTTVMNSQMKTLRTKRKRISAKIDDILFGIYNTDGYFYSVSDDFFDSDLTDFNFTDAFVDLESGLVALPTDADGTKVLNLQGGNVPLISAHKRNDLDSPLPFEQVTDFSQAIDGLTNTAWYLRIRRPEPSEGVHVSMRLDVRLTGEPINLTQVSITPHGVIPVQCSVEKRVRGTDKDMPFSSTIKTSSEKMVFVNEIDESQIDSIVLRFTKAKPDYYEDNPNGTRSGVYIIGMKELMITQQAYDNSASLVTKPLTIPEDYVNDQVISMVSMTVQESKPANTDIKYFIAVDNPEATELSDFQWKEIDPINPAGGASKKSLLDLGGANRVSNMIRRDPKSNSDIQLKPLNTVTNDPEFQNPSYSMFSDFEVYRIAEFDNEFASGTLKLEEGINTTRISYTDLSEENFDDPFVFWKEKFDDPTSYNLTYGETDVGNDFFYGADVGENEQSVFVETYVYSDRDQDVTLKEIQKTNPNSKLWDVKVFLNGREVASMPVGVDKLSAPFKINKGRNNVVVIVNIPKSSTASLVPYIGSLKMDLSDLGTTKLSDLVYVDPYKFKNGGYRDATNISPNKWFTLYNGEIVTRSKTTNNYRLSFVNPTNAAPDAIRLRADLSRFQQSNSVSPLLDSYRVRFSYPGGEFD